MPGYLYSYQRFRTELEQPIVQHKDEDAAKRLQRLIRPFVLRRLKKEVLQDLPDKLEENLYADMDGEQQELYDAHVRRMKLMLEEKSDEEIRTDKIEILAELTRLRQLCCDPALLYDNYKGGSAKTELVRGLIRNAVENGHKVLPVFSVYNDAGTPVPDFGGGKDCKPHADRLDSERKRESKWWSRLRTMKFRYSVFP